MIALSEAKRSKRLITHARQLQTFTQLVDFECRHHLALQTCRGDSPGSHRSDSVLFVETSSSRFRPPRTPHVFGR